MAELKWCAFMNRRISEVFGCDWDWWVEFVAAGWGIQDGLWTDLHIVMKHSTKLAVGECTLHIQYMKIIVMFLLLEKCMLVVNYAECHCVLREDVT